MGNWAVAKPPLLVDAQDELASGHLTHGAGGGVEGTGEVSGVSNVGAQLGDVGGELEVGGALGEGVDVEAAEALGAKSQGQGAAGGDNG